MSVVADSGDPVMGAPPIVESREEVVARMKAERAARRAAQKRAYRAARKEACGPTVYLLKFECGALYIGSTLDFVERERRHRSHIRRGTSGSRRLNEMSPDFESVVLYKCQSIKDMLRIEQETIRSYIRDFGDRVLNTDALVSMPTSVIVGAPHEGKEHIQ